MLRTSPYNATIIRRVDHHDGLFTVWLQPDTGRAPNFVAGQFCTVGCVRPGGAALMKRDYSIASSALDKEALEIFVVKVDDGKFTSWLHQQQPGTRLWLSPRVTGVFTLDGFAAGKDLVLVSTGTGIAPFISMFRTYRHDPPWRRLVLINGVRYARDLGYRQELERAADEQDNIFYLPTVTREPRESDWSGLRGRVSEVLDEDTYLELVGAPLTVADSHIFLCGTPQMIEDLAPALADRGFRTHTASRPGNLHLESYW